MASVDARIAEIRARIANPISAPVGTPASTAPVNGDGFAAELLLSLGDPTVLLGAGAGYAPAGYAPIGYQGFGTAVPARVRPPGQYGSVEPPPHFLAHGNGRIPEQLLAPIGHGHSLEPAAAAAFRQMVADAARDGVAIGVTDSYRPYEDQVSLAARKGLYSEGGLAATPGHSNHGWGLSVDLDLDAGGQDWMRRNAWRYGFVEDVPREPWHWTYRPG